MHKFFDLLLCGILFLIGSIFFPAPAFSDAIPDSDTIPFNTEKYEEFADWKIILSAREATNYLKFSRSPLYPLVCVNVKSQLRGELRGAWKEKRSYQTLWFHNGAAIGCRRYEKLSLPKDSHGIIKIESSFEAFQNTKALVNTALRLLPDIYLAKAFTLVFVVPRDLCQGVESDLSSFRFYRVRATTGDATALVLHVVSNQSGYDRYFYYSVKGGEILN